MALPKELVIGGSTLKDAKGDGGVMTSPLVTDGMFKKKAEVVAVNQIVAKGLLEEYRIAELPGGDLGGLWEVTEDVLPLWYKALWAMCASYNKRTAPCSDKYRPSNMPYVYHDAIAFTAGDTEYLMFSSGTIQKKADFDDNHNRQQDGR
jgi:hypothetical protein